MDSPEVQYDVIFSYPTIYKWARNDLTTQHNPNNNLLQMPLLNTYVLL